MSGGAVKAVPRWAEESPREQEAQEGSGSRAVFTGRARRRIDGRMKALEARRRSLERAGNRAQASTGNDRRASAGESPAS